MLLKKKNWIILCSK